MAIVRSDVFLNMPFEPAGVYRNLLVAYVSGLAALGFTARTVLELPQYELRLVRLRKMIAACGSSIHDLSCVELSNDCPRFNMPFELGLVASSPRARWFVFEAKPHRLQISLSDLNGHDPLVHKGQPRTLLAKLRDAFGNRKHATTLPDLVKVFQETERLATRLEDAQESLLGRQAFQELVVGSQSIAKRLGLV